jgi:hypothetical protein
VAALCNSGHTTESLLYGPAKCDAEVIFAWHTLVVSDALFASAARRVSLGHDHLCRSLSPDFHDCGTKVACLGNSVVYSATIYNHGVTSNADGIVV